MVGYSAKKAMKQTDPSKPYVDKIISGLNQSKLEKSESEYFYFCHLVVITVNNFKITSFILYFVISLFDITVNKFKITSFIL